MNEYQIFAADKARAFLIELERVCETDSYIKKILTSIRPSIEKIIRGEESLPTRVLDGWGEYFYPRDDYEAVIKLHPYLVQLEAELSRLLGHGDMVSYLKAKRYTEKL